MKQRKIPLRKCTGCLEMKEKKELIRVVRLEDNSYVLDFTGKKAGRGAYICNDINCLLKSQKNKGFERSFKSAIPKDVYEKLVSEIGNQNG